MYGGRSERERVRCGTWTTGCGLGCDRERERKGGQSGPGDGRGCGRCGRDAGLPCEGGCAGASEVCLADFGEAEGHGDRRHVGGRKRAAGGGKRREGTERGDGDACRAGLVSDGKQKEGSANDERAREFWDGGWRGWERDGGGAFRAMSGKADARAATEVHRLT